jgi:predicted metal-dependent enzyme (double-stranded beta helix superfamily)
MQTSPSFQAVPNARALAPTDFSESLLDRCAGGLSALIQQACLGEADLVPYRVRQALNQAIDAGATEKLLTEVLALPYSSQTYTRHVLHADPSGMFTVVALRWDANQASPVHAHYTWCAYRVLQGVLTESHFEWDRSVEQAYLFNRVERSARQSVCGHGGMDFIHRLENERAQTAVSIHVYGIDSARISSHVNRKLPVKLEMSGSK